MSVLTSPPEHFIYYKEGWLYLQQVWKRRRYHRQNLILKNQFYLKYLKKSAACEQKHYFRASWVTILHCFILLGAKRFQEIFLSNFKIKYCVYVQTRHETAEELSIKTQKTFSCKKVISPQSLMKYMYN